LSRALLVWFGLATRRSEKLKAPARRETKPRIESNNLKALGKPKASRQKRRESKAEEKRREEEWALG
jgi:hypothetical protein